MVTLSAMGVSIIVGTLLPIVVGLVTKSAARTEIKVAVQSFCAMVAGVIVSATMNDGTAIISWDTLFLAWLGWVNSMTSYLGVFKPFNANDKLAPTVGIG